MSLPRKKWEDHSARWQREHAAKGESRQRYNTWLGLSSKTRKSVPVSVYAKGISAPQYQAASTYAAAVTAMQAISSSPERAKRAVHGMTPEQIFWTAKASPAEIRARAGNRRYKARASGINPWWYNG